VDVFALVLRHVHLDFIGMNLHANAIAKQFAVLLAMFKIKNLVNASVLRNPVLPISVLLAQFGKLHRAGVPSACR
jgi:hypothetical protein